MKVKVSGKTKDYETRELPESFIEWQCKGRIKTIESMIAGKFRGNFGPHLPALCTKSVDDEFPVNSAYKGVGLIPEDEYLEETTERFENAILEYKNNWEGSVNERLNLLLDFYRDIDKIDRRKLGSVEIYGLRTYNNILKNPRVSLIFLDLESGSLSYMVDAIVEIYRDNTLFYRFEKAMHDIFHQPADGRKFPCVYIFHTCRVFNKTPGKNAGKRIV